jgi:hypothetical protein
MRLHGGSAKGDTPVREPGRQTSQPVNFRETVIRPALIAL